MKGAVVYYQPELETMPREELDALQLEQIPVHGEAGLARRLSVRHVRGTTKRGRSHSLLFGHNRHGNRGWLH